ncbi:sulfite reductase subunit beta, partial [Escherichia coli]|nr:sulfite reductase subunit beta [Escherichia coli]
MIKYNREEHKMTVQTKTKGLAWQ